MEMPSKPTLLLHASISALLLLYAITVGVTKHVIVSGKLYGNLYELSAFGAYSMVIAIVLAALFIFILPFQHPKAQITAKYLISFSFILFTITFFSNI
ncbi:hypothetical protein NBRC116495_37410 [Aurantivibrio plasticivorans]